MSYGPSKFQVDVYNDGSTEFCASRAVSMFREKMGGLKLMQGPCSRRTRIERRLSAMRPEDAWISWNLSRDSVPARVGDSRRYLPASLNVYSNDSDAHGRWMNTNDYGYVWTLIGVVADGFRTVLEDGAGIGGD